MNFSSCMQSTGGDALVLHCKRSHDDLMETVFETQYQDPREQRKRIQLKKVDTKAHYKTIALMMKASEELAQKERLRRELPPIGEIDESMSENTRAEDTPVEPAQKPFWPQLVHSVKRQ